MHAVIPGRGIPRPTRPLDPDLPDLGDELLCRSCEAKGDPDPWWPIDSQFWFLVKGWPSGHCRACFSERPRDADGHRRFPALGLAGAA